MSLNTAAMLADQHRHVEDKKNAGNKNYSNSYVLLPEKGNSDIRILPPAPNRDLPYVTTRIHALKNSLIERNVHCTKELINGRWQGKCIICDYYSALWREAETESDPQKSTNKKNQARALKPIERFYYAAIQRSKMGENNTVINNAGPLIFSTGISVHKKILAAYCGDSVSGKKPLGDISDLKNGRDFKVVKNIKKGDNFNYPDYAESYFLDPSPAGTLEEIEYWMKNLPDLDSLRIIKTQEEMKKILRVYLGLEKFESSEFDMSEFMSSNSPPSQTQTVSVQNVPVSNVESNSSTPSSTSTSEDSESYNLPDEEFFNELNSLGS